jgi:two-component system, OmpR family, response regulator
MRILVVDDHGETRELLKRNLARASHVVTAASTCAEAERALADEFDAIVLDVMLPDGSGIELCARLRARGCRVPILLLTARGEVRERVTGLEAGADDYLVKPFALAELMARVRALGRRGPMLRDQIATFGRVKVDLNRRQVSVAGRNVPLTAKELSIIEVLALQRGIVTRELLLESVWGEVSESADASLEVLIGRIRRKLGTHAAALRTVRGVGYSLEAPA